MKKMICEICNGHSIIKENDYFVCQDCGTKYTIESARNLLKEIAEEQLLISDEKEIIKDDIKEDIKIIENNEVKITNNKKEKFSKKKLITLISIGLAIIVAASISIPVSIASYRKNVYEDLQNLMMNYNRFSETSVERCIEKLPDDYKDLDEISTQFQVIKKHTKAVDDAYFYGSNGNTSKCLSARVHMHNLMVINNTSYKWDLTSYINSNLKVVLFGVEWSYDNFEISWKEKSGETWLSTDFPNDKDENKEYYYDVDFYSDNIVFSYENKNDSNERFDAYKIYSLTFDSTDFYFQMYCYSNKMTYKIKSKISQ